MKKNIYIIFVLYFSSCSITSLFSQNFDRPSAWSKYRRELILQIGATGFLGDLGGRNGTGTDFSPVDLEVSLTRPTIGAAYRYKLSKNFNWHTSFNYLRLAGDDKLTKDIYRNNRNLNFRSDVYEVATRLEFGISKVRRGGLYSMKRSLGSMRKNQIFELIGFIGIGGFYFEPKGKNPVSGGFEKLYSLHTEGQGLPGGPKQYNKVAFCIPMGLAFHYIIDRYWSVGLEFNYRKTFIDYIDDVSGRYYDKAALEQAYGPKSVLMADPSLGIIPGATGPNGDGTGAQRGDKNNDSYASVQLTIGRFFPPKRRKTRLRSKF